MIVALGDAIVDLFAQPVGCDVSDAVSFVPRQGGAPLNVVMTAARLGLATRFVGAVGTDAHGDRLVAAMREAGVDPGAVLRVPQRTGVTFVRVGLDGARSFLFYRQGGADLSLPEAHIASLDEAWWGGAGWLYFTSSARVVEPMAGAAEAAITAAERHGVARVVDLNVRAHLWPDRSRMEREVRALVHRAHLVKASEEDLVALGLPPTLQALESLIDPAQHTVAILTLAERGATVRIAGEVLAVPAPSVHVVDATGAGDAFVAGVLAVLVRDAVGVGSPAWGRGETWDAALRFGCALGARAVTVLGATEGLRSLEPERAALGARGNAGHAGRHDAPYRA